MIATMEVTVTVAVEATVVQLATLVVATADIPVDTEDIQYLVPWFKESTKWFTLWFTREWLLDILMDVVMVIKNPIGSISVMK